MTAEVTPCLTSPRDRLPVYPGLEFKKVQFGCISHLIPVPTDAVMISREGRLSDKEMEVLKSYKFKIVSAFIQHVKIEQLFLYHSQYLEKDNENSDDGDWIFETTANTVKRTAAASDYAVCFSSRCIEIGHGNYSDAGMLKAGAGGQVLYFYAENYCDIG